MTADLQFFGDSRGEMSIQLSRSRVFECLLLSSMLPSTIQTHGFRVHNQTAVSELKSLYGESIVWPSVLSNHFQYHSTFVTLDSVYFNCNFNIVSVGCFTIYRLQSVQTGVLQLASHCHEMPVPHVNYINTTASHLGKGNSSLTSSSTVPFEG